MANFVKINEKNIVIDSIVIPDEVKNGQEYISNIKLEGRWIESSEDNFAGIGYYYNESIERFEEIIDYSLESNLTYKLKDEI